MPVFKTHYEHESYRIKFSGTNRAYTACGTMVDKERTTRDINKVTCGVCKYAYDKQKEGENAAQTT